MARVVLGAGGHARVISALTKADCLGVDDPVPADADILIGVGDLATRIRLYDEYATRVVGVIDKSALIAGDCRAGYGLQVLAGVIVNVGVKFGVNVLVNVGAQIDHECVIGDHCIISPGAILCGRVQLGNACFIGAGAIIVQGVKLDAGAFVPAGTLVAGPDDFRRPERVVRFGRAAETATSAAE